MLKKQTVVVGVFLCFALCVVSRLGAQSEASAAPCTVLRPDYSGARGGPPQPFEVQVARTSVIVDARVQALQPSGLPRAEPAMPDVLFGVTQVLKGPGTLQQFAIAQLPGAPFEMQVGQRFILFLGDPDPAARVAFPERPGLARYALRAILCVENAKVHAKKGAPLDTFEGTTPETLLTEIKRIVAGKN